MPLQFEWLVQCQPEGFRLLAHAVLQMPKRCCLVGPTEAFPVELLVPCPRLTSLLAVSLLLEVVVQLVARLCATISDLL